jgi:hypothetical protein
LSGKIILPYGRTVLVLNTALMIVKTAAGLYLDREASCDDFTVLSYIQMKTETKPFWHNKVR